MLHAGSHFFLDYNSIGMCPLFFFLKPRCFQVTFGYVGLSGVSGGRGQECSNATTKKYMGDYM